MDWGCTLLANFFRSGPTPCRFKHQQQQQREQEEEEKEQKLSPATFFVATALLSLIGRVRCSHGCDTLLADSACCC